MCSMSNVMVCDACKSQCLQAQDLGLEFGLGRPMIYGVKVALKNRVPGLHGGEMCISL